MISLKYIIISSLLILPVFPVVQKRSLFNQSLETKACKNINSNYQAPTGFTSLNAYVDSLNIQRTNTFNFINNFLVGSGGITDVKSVVFDFLPSIISIGLGILIFLCKVFL